MKKSPASLIIGSLFILLGFIFLCNELGIISLSIFASLARFWPVGLIIAGIALYMKQRLLSVTFIILTIMLAAAGISADFHPESGETREIIQEQELEKGISSLTLDVGFGAGEVKIKKGENETLIKNTVKTNGPHDPAFEYYSLTPDAKVSIDREEHGFTIFRKLKEHWVIELSPLVTHDLDLDYGASHMEVDLQGLKVDSLNIDSGATSTHIIFERYPTKVEVDTGASEVTLDIPRDYSVKIHVSGGAVGVSLPEFTKKDGYYYSPGFTKDEFIDVEVDAGATSINGIFHE